MSLEAHHRFILDTLQRNQDIAQNIINKLEAENARLRKLFADTERLMLLDGEYEAAKVGTYADLKAEVERLRKAGDDLYRSMFEIGCNEMADNFQYDAWWGSMNAWNAAKEGKQP